MSNSHSFDHDRLATEARGDLDKDLFTETGSGSLTAEGYLADRPPVAYVKDDEQPHYLLAGDEGLTVRLRSNVETTDEREGVYTTADSYRATALVTDTRVLFLIGRGDGNEAVEVPLRRIEAVQSDTALMHQKLEVTDDSYDYVFKTERPAAVDEAVAYLREQLDGTDDTVIGMQPGDHELFPEGLAEYAPSAIVLETAADGTLSSVQSDLAWLTGVHATLGTTVADDGPSPDTQRLLDTVEELLSVLQVVESVLSQADEKEATVDTEAVQEAQSAVAGTPLDVPRLDGLLEEVNQSGQEDPFTDPDIVDSDDPTLVEKSPELRQELQRLVGSCHRIPTREDVVDRAKHDVERFEQYGESWEAVLESAGFNLRGRMIDHLQETNEKSNQMVTPARLSGTTYEYSRYLRVFGDWGAALDAAGLDGRRGEMFAAIQSCHDELDHVPEVTDLEELTEFGPDEYVAEFGSVQSALAAADIKDTHLDDSGTDQEGVSKASADDDRLSRCPLSEWYDSLRILRKLQRSIYGAGLTDLPDNDPGAVWVKKVEAIVGSSGLEEWEAGYGQQHRNRVDHSIRSYRDAYGDGDRVTEFSTVEVASVPVSVVLLASSDTVDDLCIPVAPESEMSLPVVVTDESELERAEGLLAELPAQPAVKDDTDDLADTGQHTTEPGGETPPSGTETEPGTTESSDDESDEGESANTTSNEVSSEVEHAAVEELTTVNGVDEETAQTLIAAGYEGVDALTDATTDELTSLEGIDSGRAFRITFALDD